MGCYGYWPGPMVCRFGVRRLCRRFLGVNNVRVYTRISFIRGIDGCANVDTLGTLLRAGRKSKAAAEPPHSKEPAVT
jgi:hypothetical protein